MRPHQQGGSGEATAAVLGLVAAGASSLLVRHLPQALPEGGDESTWDRSLMPCSSRSLALHRPLPAARPCTSHRFRRIYQAGGCICGLRSPSDVL